MLKLKTYIFVLLKFIAIFLICSTFTKERIYLRGRVKKNIGQDGHLYSNVRECKPILLSPTLVRVKKAIC